MPATPGPWRIAPRFRGAAATAVTTEDGELIATVHDEHQDAEANARLIVQAPGMFAALQRQAELDAEIRALLDDIRGAA